jgi:hypothetical protein
MIMGQNPPILPGNGPRKRQDNQLGGCSPPAPGWRHLTAGQLPACSPGYAGLASAGLAGVASARARSTWLLRRGSAQSGLLTATGRPPGCGRGRLPGSRTVACIHLTRSRARLRNEQEGPSAVAHAAGDKPFTLTVIRLSDLPYLVIQPAGRSAGRRDITDPGRAAARAGWPVAAGPRPGYAVRHYDQAR